MALSRDALLRMIEAQRRMSAALAEKRAMPTFYDAALGGDTLFDDDTLIAAEALEFDNGAEPDAPVWGGTPPVEPPPFPRPLQRARPVRETSPATAAAPMEAPPPPEPADPSNPFLEALFDALTAPPDEGWEYRLAPTGPADSAAEKDDPTRAEARQPPEEASASSTARQADAEDRPIMDAPVPTVSPGIEADAADHTSDDTAQKAGLDAATPLEAAPGEAVDEGAWRPLDFDAELVDPLGADACKNDFCGDGDLPAEAELEPATGERIPDLLVADEPDALEDAAAQVDLSETWSPPGAQWRENTDEDAWSFLDSDAELEADGDALDDAFEAEAEDNAWASADWLAEADQDDAELDSLGVADPRENLEDEEIARIRARRTAALMVAQMDFMTQKRRDLFLNSLMAELLDFPHGSTRTALLRLAPEIDDEADLFAAFELKRLWREEARFWLRRTAGSEGFDGGGLHGLTWPLALKLVTAFGHFDPEDILWPLYEEWLEKGARRQNAVSFAAHLQELMNEGDKPGQYFDRDTDPADAMAAALRSHRLSVTHPHRLGAGIKAKNC